jgi:hypothetical protein
MPKKFRHYKKLSSLHSAYVLFYPRHLFVRNAALKIPMSGLLVQRFKDNNYIIIIIYNIIIYNI